jgi:hypothetical protein
VHPLASGSHTRRIALADLTPAVSTDQERALWLQLYYKHTRNTKTRWQAFVHEWNTIAQLHQRAGLHQIFPKTLRLLQQYHTDTVRAAATNPQGPMLGGAAVLIPSLGSPPLPLALPPGGAGAMGLVFGGMQQAIFQQQQLPPPQQLLPPPSRCRWTAAVLAAAAAASGRAPPPISGAPTAKRMYLCRSCSHPASQGGKGTHYKWGKQLVVVG